MPKKIRELKSRLRKPGFICQPAKSSHSKWKHPQFSQAIVIAGQDGSDAKIYLEKQVNEALAELKKIEDEEAGGGGRGMNYTVIIQWSQEDECFIVFLPEFEDVMQPVTHGDSYEAAIKNAQEVIELLIDSYRESGKALPAMKNLERLIKAA